MILIDSCIILFMIKGELPRQSADTPESAMIFLMFVTELSLMIWLNSALLMCYVCLRIRTLSRGAIIDYEEKIAAELINHCLYMLFYLG